ncbi:TonB-dependent siderophore receptor [Cardiobacterium hominis]|uniref:TonB-dependent siderophore receptor n=1 Tax=Cardiobacterium hominis TaxID=2718 RepID=UPI0028E40C5D|nr:TonB-dependent siderophore receptor [Cardiobacterium hominis]
MRQPFPAHLSRKPLISLTSLAMLAPAAFAASGEPATLAPVVVNAERSLETNYTIPASISATGLDLTLRETPQSISVMTQKRMEEQQLNSVSEVIAHAPGIYFQKYGNSADGYHYYISRGYRIDNVNIDGLDASGDGSGYGLSLHNTDSAVYESASVVRGSTGLRNGIGDPGGNIQMQRKRPTAEPHFSIDVGAGTWGHYRTVFDGNGALNHNGSLRGRAVAIYDRGGLWQRRARQDGKTLYGILEYDLTPQTMVSAGLQLSDVHSKHSTPGSFSSWYGDADSGYRLLLMQPRDNNAAEWSYSKRRRSEVFARLEHDFNDDWKLSAAYSYRFGKADNHYGIGGSYDVKADGSAQLVTIKENFHPTEHAFDMHLDGKYPLFSRQHEFQMGISHNDYRDGKNAKYDTRADDPVDDLFAFVRDGKIERPENELLGYGTNKKQTTSLYGATRIHLNDDWALLAGVRLTNWKRTGYDFRNDYIPRVRKENGVFTPYLGLTYDFTNNLTAYANYSTIFQPQDNEDINHNPLDPEKGATYELGVKGAWLDDRLNASAAVFEVRKDNLAVKAGEHADGSDYYRAEDNTKGRGWELTLSGEPLPDWRVDASYTRTKIEDRTGARLKTDAPLHLFKAFSSYDVNEQWTIGGGINWQSKIFAKSEIDDPVGIVANTQKSYATVDLMAQYRPTKKLRFTLNANNLFDQKYKTIPDALSFGAPRHVMATFRYEF